MCDLLKKEGKLGEGKVAKYTCQLLEGLLYLHNCSHVHRNLKCSNILLDEHGGIKLADYGRFEYLRGKVLLWISVLLHVFVLVEDNKNTLHIVCTLVYTSCGITGLLLLQSSDVVKQTSTAWWMAPEVIEGSTPSEKSDIW